MQNYSSLYILYLIYWLLNYVFISNFGYFLIVS